MYYYNSLFYIYLYLYVFLWNYSLTYRFIWYEEITSANADLIVSWKRTEYLSN